MTEYKNKQKKLFLNKQSIVFPTLFTVAYSMEPCRDKNGYCVALN